MGHMDTSRWCDTSTDAQDGVPGAAAVVSPGGVSAFTLGVTVTTSTTTDAEGSSSRPRTASSGRN